MIISDTLLHQLKDYVKTKDVDLFDECAFDLQDCLSRILFTKYNTQDPHIAMDALRLAWQTFSKVELGHFDDDSYRSYYTSILYNCVRNSINTNRYTPTINLQPLTFVPGIAEDDMSDDECAYFNYAQSYTPDCDYALMTAVSNVLSEKVAVNKIVMDCTSKRIARNSDIRTSIRYINRKLSLQGKEGFSISKLWYDIFPSIQNELMKHPQVLALL